MQKNAKFAKIEISFFLQETKLVEYIESEEVRHLF